MTSRCFTGSKTRTPETVKAHHRLTVDECPLLHGPGDDAHYLARQVANYRDINPDATITVTIEYTFTREHS